MDWFSFLSNPTGVGLLALAILGTLFLIKQLIEYLQKNVLPEYFKWRLEKRKLIIPFADRILDREWREPAFFRAGIPKFVDFEQGYVLIRPEIEHIKANIKRHRFVHVEGLPSSGKSVIAFTIAYQEIKAKHTVIYFSRPTLIPDSFFDSILVSLRSRLDKKNVLIIVDDVHLDVAAASKLFAPIYGSLDNVNLLFVSRPRTRFRKTFKNALITDCATAAQVSESPLAMS